MLRFLDQDIQPDPTPHIFSQEYFDRDYFLELKEQFPGESYFARGGGGRQTRKNRLNLETPSPVFYEFLEQAPAWQRLHEYVTSDEFVDALVNKFGGYLNLHGCNVVETRDQLTAKLQICRSFSGYRTPVHTDRAHKVFISLVYFNDQTDYGEGGEFCYYEVKALRMEKRRKAAFSSLSRSLKDGRIIRTIFPQRFIRKVGEIVPRENVGVSMINAPISFHKVNRIKTNGQPRRFMYITLMAKEAVDQWSGFQPYI